MTYDPGKHHRRSIRLAEWDYRRPGWYFVTICVQNRKCVFGEVGKSSIVLSTLGILVRNEWLNIPKWFPMIRLDDFIVMPNHIHGIVIMNESRRGLINQTPTETGAGNWILMKQHGTSLGSVIHAFKARTARLMHQSGDLSICWQRNYFDHIIRNDADLLCIRTYIANNPLQWSLDEENRENMRRGIPQVDRKNPMKERMSLAPVISSRRFGLRILEPV